MKAYGISEVGKVRQNNEDRYIALVNKVNDLPNLVVLADGMGGHNAGEVASVEAIARFCEYAKYNNVENEDYEKFMKECATNANIQTYMKSFGNRELIGMGTTLSAITVVENIAYISHVGDSRVYVLQNRKLEQITTDHTFVNELIVKGLISKEEAKVHPKRNVITRTVGFSPEVEVDTHRIELMDKFTILICSDGLNGMVSDEVIEKILKMPLPMEKRARELVDKALKNGGEDNITVVLLEK